MLGIYFSGTGNTKHCMEKLMSCIEPKAQVIALENPRTADLIKQNEIIYIAYPIYYSNTPYMVRDFISTHAEWWKGKSVFCIATMGLFSGDGAGCSARLLRKYGATILGGLHIRMPDAICDVRALKKTVEQNREIVKNADRKIEQAAAKIRMGKYPMEGLSFISHVLGLFGQRLWFYGKTANYSQKLKISDACVGCGLCSENCPMHNIVIKEGKAIAGDKCTMCYRCISHCPKKAITLIGKQVIEQCHYEKYKV